MTEQRPWLEPIRTAAVAVAADPPSLTEWEAGEDGEGEIADDEVEKLLQELGWPSRTRTFTAEITVLGSDPYRTVPHECTETYFPATWLNALADRVAEYEKVRDAGREPTVPDRFRLRNLPAAADFDAFRDLVEGAWDEAGDELACSIALMPAWEVAGLDGLRLNLATALWYGPNAFDGDPEPSQPSAARANELPFAEWLRREEEGGFLSDLRTLPSPKWRAWFIDTWNDRIEIHDVLDRCGVEAAEHLGVSLWAARYSIDTDTDRMTVAELVSRIEARHRLLVAAMRAAREGGLGDKPGGRPGLIQRRLTNPPAGRNTMMETVARLKGANVQWKEIKEQVEASFGYRFDSGEALRKQFGRWLRNRVPGAG